MLDTNGLVSVLLFPSPQMDALMRCIFTEHELLLSSYVVRELEDVVCRRFPTKGQAISRFLQSIDFVLVDTPTVIAGDSFGVRDPKDYPVLHAALIGNADVLITGDKDFGEVRLMRPRILTPTKFLACATGLLPPESG